MLNRIQINRTCCCLFLMVAGFLSAPAELYAQGACCIIVDGVGSCLDNQSPIQCVNQPGGLYLGDGTTCEEEGFRCELGACCTLAGCVILRQSDCFAGGGFGFEVGVDCTADPCGACCSPLGDCTDTSVSDCGNQDGAIFFSAVFCDTNPCPPPPTGACCTIGACAENVTPQDCAAAAGHWAGPNSTCSDEPLPCEEGACCNGTDCSFITRAECANSGGTFTSGVSCEPSPCAAPMGACCAESICLISVPENCTEEQGRIYLGDGTTCEGDPCGVPPDPTGACCTESGCVANVTSVDCAANAGVYLGNNSTCQPGVCDTGACCRGAVCTIELQFLCTQIGGEFLGADTTCDDDPCGAPPTGACCRSDGLCEPDVDPANCTEPDTFLGTATTCTPGICESGACCTDAGCVDLSDTECNAAGGLFIDGATCAQSPCGPGACCNDDICVFAPAFPCFSGGRTFLGAGIPCMPNNPCVGCETCPGDANGDSVRDGRDVAVMIDCILNPDPQLCKCADMNDDAATTLADIGQFVNAMLSNTGPC